LKIIHVDMDAFYASVEQRDHPEWRGRPLVVGGSPEGRGVIASASYEARKFGIRSAMSSAKAIRLCPDLVFVRPNISHYVEVSRQIREIFLSVTPKVEPLSLDEAYLDVTENLLNDPLASRIAKHIKARIFNELGLTASAGVGPNKFIAKVASDLKKPDGLVVVPPEQVPAFVEKLPVERLWGVGPATAKKLHEQGLWTAADIRKKTILEMEVLLGSYGRFIHGLAHGEDSRQVEADRPSKSSGSETTFERDILDVDYLEQKLKGLSEEIAQDLRAQERPGKTITLKVRYEDFNTITRSRTLRARTDNGDAIFRVACELLRGHTEAGVRPIRLVGISVSGLRDESEPEQLSLQFPPPWDI
jgi:DNA polymerase-4